MGGELLSLSPTDEKQKTTMTEVFWEAYPAYLSMGMPGDEYWNGDAQACVAYRRAHEERLKLQDLYAWRQGLYVYHAMCCVAPYFNTLKPHKPERYIEPFSSKSEPKDESAPMQNGIAFVKAWADRVNAKRNNNGGKRSEH